MSVYVVLVSLLLTLGNSNSSIHLSFTLNMFPYLLGFSTVSGKIFCTKSLFQAIPFLAHGSFQKNFFWMGCLGKNFSCVKDSTNFLICNLKHKFKVLFLFSYCQMRDAICLKQIKSNILTCSFIWIFCHNASTRRNFYVRSQQGKHRIKMQNIFKVNNEDTGMWSMTSF